MDTGHIGRLIGLIFLSAAAYAQDLAEYCEDETFIGRCADDEAIVIRSAQYGRMRIGRCVSENVRLGCKMDVLTQLDKWCSGRPSCEVHVTSLLQQGTKPCPKDYRSFLEASYSCIPVVQASKDECLGQHPVKITAKHGYISSLVTNQSGCGSIDSPWLLEAEPGQRINITLYDFSMYNAAPKQIDSSVCMVYAIIKEPSGGVTETVCGGVSRVNHAFTSTSSLVEVRLRGRQNSGGAHFVLKYDSVGCPLPRAPPGGWARRDGTVRAVYGCNHSDVTWTAECKGTEWVGPDGECPHGANDPNSARSLLNSSSIPNGMSIVLVVGIALIVGLCILLVGLLCLRRQRLRAGHHHYDSASAPRGPQQPGYDATKPPGGQLEYYVHPNGENDYYRTWQLQQRRGVGPPSGPLPLPVDNGDHSVPPQQTYRALSTDSSFSAQNGRYSEHLYESPKFDRRDFPEDNGTDKYFELDPEAPPLPHGNGMGSRDHLGTMAANTPKTDCSLAKR